MPGEEPEPLEPLGLCALAVVGNTAVVDGALEFAGGVLVEPGGDVVEPGGVVDVGGGVGDVVTAGPQCLFPISVPPCPRSHGVSGS